ncbi:hypothetical protein FACS1894202_04500 [Clostridia bacterium]|nr:hypothetical protein FACS1894202_04500 [Clostridia bacterium]
MYFIGLAVFIAALIVDFVLKGVSPSLVNNPAAIITIILAVTAVIAATGSFRSFVMGLNAAASKRYVISGEDKQKAEDLFRLLTRVTIYTTTITLVISAASILVDLSDVEKIGHGITSALAAIIIGAFFALAVFEPLAFILKHRAPAPENTKYPRELADKLLEMCLQNGITPEDIKNATDIELK